jgi:GPH family glycoside/pentoside/hexuronide:cation symporter
MPASTADERIHLSTKLFYGAGDLTNSLFNTILAVHVLYFLINVVGLPGGLASLAIFLGRSADWINDPIVGHISDRTRSRWGRRRPFLLFGLVPVALAFMLFFWVPPWTNPLILAAHYGLMYMLYDTIATFVYVPYYTLTPELTLDYDERTSLSTARMLFSIVGGLIAFTLPTLLIDSFADPRTGYFVMAIVFGGLGALPLLLTFFGTRERPEYQTMQQPTLRDSLSAMRGNRPFQFGLGIFLLTWTTIDIIQAVLLFFIVDWLHMGSTSELIMGSVFVSAALFLPLWGWLSERWDKRQAYIAGMIFFAVVMLALIFLGPSTPLWGVFAVTTLAGVGVAAAHVIPWSILPDAIEWDELQTGQRHEGAFYSLVTLAQKVASSIALPLVGLLLDATGYVEANAGGAQPASALLAIRGLMGVVPSIMLVGGIVFALRYPLSRESHAAIRRQLAERRVEAV